MRHLYKSIIHFSILLLSIILCTACETDNHRKEDNIPSEPITANAPQFDADKAYQFIEKQLAFGSRVPETPAHDSCANWLFNQFNQFAAHTVIQKAEVDGHQGRSYNIKNIIASYNVDAKARILLCAHWDTRSVADQDTERKKEPIPGADDGGSGVGILLEVARILGNKQLKNIGVDIVLFDAEDQGGSGVRFARESWCLGAQHWSRNPHQANYKAQFGILLDMAGARGARFAKEGVSVKHASTYVNLVWETAWNLGYSDFFVNVNERQIVDDHVFVNEIRKIPTIDIINLPENSPTGFGAYWHTHKDNIDIISKPTLKAVGQTILQVLYQEDVTE